MNNITKDQLIQQWHSTCQQLETLKALEMQLRLEVLKEYFKYKQDDREGTQREELGNDYELKAVFRLNYRLDASAVPKALYKIEKHNGEGKFIAERLIKWKPELVISEYRKLPDKYLKIINEVLTVIPGTPSLDLIAP